MDVFTLGLFLLIIVNGVSTELQPQYAAVLQGSSAQFYCSSTQPPQIMTFTLNGRLVVTITQTSGVLNSTDRFSATNFTTPGNYKWQFTISNVQRSDAGVVACQVLGGDAVTATLSVQERGTVKIAGGNQSKTIGVQAQFSCLAVGWYPEPNMSWSVNGETQFCNKSSISQGGLYNSSCTLTLTASKNSTVQCLAAIPALNTPDSNTVFLTVVKIDQTVLIAITVAFSAAALLFLIIYGIVFFCRRKKKKSSYQEEVRRARVQSQNRIPAIEEVRGRDNRGYITDGRDRHNNGGVWYTKNSNRLQLPDDFFGDDQRKHRHMTMV